MSVKAPMEETLAPRLAELVSALWLAADLASGLALETRCARRCWRSSSVGCSGRYPRAGHRRCRRLLTHGSRRGFVPVRRLEGAVREMG